MGMGKEFERLINSKLMLINGSPENYKVFFFFLVFTNFSLYLVRSKNIDFTWTHVKNGPINNKSW